MTEKHDIALPADTSTTYQMERRPSRPRRTYKARGQHAYNPDLFEFSEEPAPVKPNPKTQSAGQLPRTPRMSKRPMAGALAACAVFIASAVGYFSWNTPATSHADVATATSVGSVDSVRPEIVAVLSASPSEMKLPEPEGSVGDMPIAVSAVSTLDPPLFLTPTAVTNPMLVTDVGLVGVASYIAVELGDPGLDSLPKSVPVAETVVTSPDRPAMLAATTPSTVFMCDTCQTFDPQLQNVVFNINVTQDFPAAEITLIADITRNMGVVDFAIVTADVAVSYTQVRFFHAEDTGAAHTLAKSLGATAVDFTWITPLPPLGVIDLMLAVQDPSQ